MTKMEKKHVNECYCSLIDRDRIDLFPRIFAFNLFYSIQLQFAITTERDFSISEKINYINIETNDEVFGLSLIFLNNYLYNLSFHSQFWIFEKKTFHHCIKCRKCMISKRRRASHSCHSFFPTVDNQHKEKDEKKETRVPDEKEREIAKGGWQQGGRDTELIMKSFSRLFLEMNRCSETRSVRRLERSRGN